MTGIAAAAHPLAGLGGWAGTGAAVIVAGLAYLLMRHLDRMPKLAHPWLHRAVIIGMFCAGTAFVLTPAGTFITGIERDITGWLGGTSSGVGWWAITLATLFLAAEIAVILIWDPGLGFAWAAMAAPLVMSLAPGGFAASVYAAAAIPGRELVAVIAAWAGG